MTPYKTMAHIHSLNGEMDEITVLDINESGRQTTYIVDYRGVKALRFLILSPAPTTQTTFTGGWNEIFVLPLQLARNADLRLHRRMRSAQRTLLPLLLIARGYPKIQARQQPQIQTHLHQKTLLGD